MGNEVRGSNPSPGPAGTGATGGGVSAAGEGKKAAADAPKEQPKEAAAPMGRTLQVSNPTTGVMRTITEKEWNEHDMESEGFIKPDELKTEEEKKADAEKAEKQEKTEKAKDAKDDKDKGDDKSRR